MTDDSTDQNGDAQRALVDLAQIMVGDRPLTVTLQQIAGLVKQVVPNVVDVSVTVMEGDKARTMVFTGPLAMDLDERQYGAGFGPCMDAAITGNTVVLDMADSDLYADFRNAARRRGVTHTLSIALPVPERIVGALNVYISDAQPISADLIALTEQFAGFAAVAVANATLYTNTVAQVQQLQEAMQSRRAIEQAKGILMNRNRYSGDAAFVELSRLSQTRGIRLRDVAAEIVDSALDH